MGSGNNDMTFHVERLREIIIGEHLISDDDGGNFMAKDKLEGELH